MNKDDFVVIPLAIIAMFTERLFSFLKELGICLQQANVTMVKKSQRTAAVNNHTLSLNEDFSDQN